VVVPSICPGAERLLAGEGSLRYICLGYAEERRWEAMTESERKAFVADCLAYDEELRRDGYVVGGEALQGIRSAVTLRARGGEVSVTDGPFAETREQLGGLMVLEARDLNHAIALVSKHPGLKGGCFEIRPALGLESLKEGRNT
jgi:hypothetical protein